MLSSEDSEDSRLNGVVGRPTRIDGVLMSYFMDALRREGVRQARVLQALFWVLNEEQYYCRLPYFSIQECSTLLLFEEHILPVRMGGLWVVSLIWWSIAWL